MTKPVVERLADFDAEMVNAILSRVETLRLVLYRYQRAMPEAGELYAELFGGQSDDLENCGGTLLEAKKLREGLCQELVGRV